MGAEYLVKQVQNITISIPGHNPSPENEVLISKIILYLFDKNNHKKYIFKMKITKSRQRLLFLLLFVAFFSALSYAQNPQLAMHYFNRGEFEKAESMFKELVQKQPQNSVYFEKLMDSQIQLQKYDEALSSLQDRINRFPNDPINHLLKGNLFELKKEQDKADESFQKAVDIAAKEPSTIARLAQEFQEKNKFEWALKAYQASAADGGEIHPSFTLPMATLHYRLGEYSEMIDRYLDAVEHRPESASFVLNYFQRYLPDDFLDELKRKVIRKLQSSSEESFNEILAWAYIQDNDFAMAYRQLRSIDKRKQENGHRVFRLGENAFLADQYQDAIRILDYIIQEKGRESPYYYKSHELTLQAKRAHINMENESNRLDQISDLVEEYLHFADSLGYNRFTAPLIKDLAEIQAFELHDYPASVKTLEELVKINNLNPNFLSESKVLLADIYLSTGDRWEATLLYSQVDKAHKEDEIGQMARFKNAKLSYYMGDFQWAQKQFDILRVATSRLIANDAIDMNVFIIDNMGLDTTDQHLKEYAAADFHYFKNEKEQALQKLENLRNKLSEDHSLQDDIIYLEAKIHADNQDYDIALEKYQQIVDFYPDGIWADNALFEMGNIYLNKLLQPQKAMEVFEKLFMDFSNSILAVDARKNFRELRKTLSQQEMETEEKSDKESFSAP